MQVSMFIYFVLSRKRLNILIQFLSLQRRLYIYIYIGCLMIYSYNGLLCLKFCITHWGRMTHICVGKLTIIGSDNGLSPGRRQAIIWKNAGILLIGTLITNFSEISIEIQTFSLKKMRLKMSSAKCCSFRLGLNMLIQLSHCNVSHATVFYQNNRQQRSDTYIWFTQWCFTVKMTANFRPIEMRTCANVLFCLRFRQT